MIKTTLLDWDTDVLGFRVAKIEAPTIDHAALKKTIALLMKDNVDCVYFSAKNDDLVAQEAAVACGGVLVDWKTTYQVFLQDVSFVPSPEVIEYTDEQVTPDLVALAFEIGENSRFYRDQRMPADAYQKIYCRWMENAVNRSVADSVKVIQRGSSSIAVVTLVDKGDYGNISLIAVDPQYRGQGLAGKLVDAAFVWCKEKNFSRCEVVTQKTNQAACALYEHKGFTLKSVECFYHIWL